VRAPGTGVCVVVVGLCCPAAARSQTVTGTVVEENRRPVPVAFVTLQDSSGRRVAASLSDSAGAFHVTVARAGRYALRAERIGYRSALSPLLSLAAGQSVRHDITVAANPITVAEITVRKERGCAVRPQEGTIAAKLWEDVRKALTVTAWAAEGRMFYFDAVRYIRFRNPTTLRVTRDSVLSRGITTGRPFISLAATRLAEHGYLENTDSGSYFFAPDAEALLSDSFLDTHCFRLELDPQRDDLLGLAFKPVKGNNKTEIDGVLWIYRTTEALKQLDFRYVNLPGVMPTSGSGGHVEFEELPSGGWVVSRWYIRAPMVVIGGTRMLGRELTDARIVAFRDYGGNVLRVLDRENKLIREFPDDGFGGKPRR
jgi:hypothetical protein